MNITVNHVCVPQIISYILNSIYRLMIKKLGNILRLKPFRIN